MRHILEGFDWAALGKGYIVDVSLSLQRPLHNWPLSEAQQILGHISPRL